LRRRVIPNGIALLARESFGFALRRRSPQFCAVTHPRGPSLPRGALQRDALLSINLFRSPNSEGSMARSKSKQKIKRHRHKLRRNRALARKKAAKTAKD
jgi:hypothetical protein